MIFVTIVFEDDLSEAVINKILNHFPGKFTVIHSYSGNGFGYLKKNIKGFNQASAINPHFMLTDLDNYECPTALKKDWINFELNSHFIFRIAVREVESWLLADHEGLSNFLGVSPTAFPRNPEELTDPKNKLIQLAKRSRKRSIREDIVPLNNNACIGPNYNGCLSTFVSNNWSITNAIEHSNSLKKTIARLHELSA